MAEGPAHEPLALNVKFTIWYRNVLATKGKRLLWRLNHHPMTSSTEMDQVPLIFMLGREFVVAASYAVCPRNHWDRF
jgi:hypothetical protein